MLFAINIRLIPSFPSVYSDEDFLRQFVELLLHIRLLLTPFRALKIHRARTEWMQNGTFFHERQKDLYLCCVNALMAACVHSSAQIYALSVLSHNWNDTHRLLTKRTTQTLGRCAYTFAAYLLMREREKKNENLLLPSLLLFSFCRRSIRSFLGCGSKKYFRFSLGDFI